MVLDLLIIDIKFKSPQLLLALVAVLLLTNDAAAHDATALQALAITDTTVTLQWTENPAEPDEDPHKFKVLAVPVESHSELYMGNRLEWFFDYETNQAELVALSPGTRYNITVWTVHEDFIDHPVQGMFWTKIGDPEIPPPVTLISKGQSTIDVSFNGVRNSQGPISAYQLVVVIDPQFVIFNPDMLYGYEEAKEKAISFYITAALSESDVRDLAKFTIGDGEVYGGYHNAPLQKDEDHAVIIGLVSSLNGISKRSFSEIAEFPGVSIEGSSDDPVQTAWTISIGVIAFLLVFAVLLYIILRRYYKPPIRRPSEQQLAVSNPAFDGTNGDIPTSDGIYLDDINVKVTDNFEHLPNPIWKIPEDSLQVHKQIIGYGRFGQVQTGIVHKKPQQITAMIITMQAPSMMTSEEKRNSTHEVDAMHRVSCHPHVVALIGQTEIKGSLYIAIEYSPENLLVALCSSRCVDLSLGHSSAKTVTSFSSNQLMQHAFDIAKGLQYLHQHKVIHCHMMAGNVLMVHGVPKLANFGLASFEQHTKFSNTRWCSSESLQSKRHSFKSDIWSLAIVVWEISTFGGTPYCSLTNKEVIQKVLQGTRLPQPSSVSYDLFQLLLDCWQTDPDERPNINTVVQALDIMVKDNRDHINVKYYSGFQYHRYIPLSEC